MKEMTKRDPKKAAVDKNLATLLGRLIKSKDHYTSFVWAEDHYEITTRSGKKYHVSKEKLTEV